VDLLAIRQLPESGEFALEGELDIASAEVLLSRVDGVPEGDLVLDLSGLSFMDSSGLRAILRLAQSRNGNSSVVLRNPTQPVARVLGIAMPGNVPGVRVEAERIDVA
jgi:anti-anti-sigma factor